MRSAAARWCRGGEAAFYASLLVAGVAAPATARPAGPFPWESGTKARAVRGEGAMGGTWRGPLRRSEFPLRSWKYQNRTSRLESRQSATVDHQFLSGLEPSPYDPIPRLTLAPALGYSTFLGGSSFDVATDVAVDSTGSIYVAGYTNSVDFPRGTVTRLGQGGGTCGRGVDVYRCFDAFVAKLDPTGSRLERFTYLGGSGDDYATAVAVDASGNVYVTGFTNSADWPTARALQADPGGGLCGDGNPVPCYDAFVAKLDPTGTTLVYSTYLGGSADDYGQGIAVDSAENAVVAGLTASADFPTAAALQSVHGGGLYDAFATKLLSTGLELAYSTYLGGSGDDHGSDVAVDAYGNAYLTGYTNSVNFPVANPFQAAHGGGACGTPANPTACFDAFVAKLDAEGPAVVYSTYLGGSGGDYGYGIVVDASGNAYVTGLTTSTNFPVTAGAFQLAGGGTSVDAFVSKLDGTGSSAVYATYLGGSGAEAGLDMAVDSAGNAYVAGYAYGGGLPLASPLQPTIGGYYDAFLSKLNATGSALVFSTYLGGSGNEKARGVAVDPAGNAYLTGDTFSTDFPTTSGAFQTSYGSGAFDAFVAKVGNLALPVLRLSERRVTFPAQDVGTTSPCRAIALTNDGDAELTIDGVVVTGDFAQTHDCPGTLAPGARCTLSVSFTPAELGPQAGLVSIASDAYGTPHNIELVGTGVASPAASLSATYLRFPNQPLGTTSAPKAVTLTNSGQAPLFISTITTSGTYAQASDCASPLAVSSSCTINLSFTPPATVAGGQAGTLTITDNAPGSPHTVALGGVGVGPVAVLSATGLNFGNQPVGTTSAAKLLNLSNTGNAPMAVTSVTISGDFGQTSNCPGTLPARSYCTLRLTFTPTAAGTRTGAISVTDDAAGSPRTVALSGIGTIAPAVGLCPTRLHFADQPLGTTGGPLPVKLTNTGNAPLAVTSMSTSGAYAQVNNCASPLAAGGYCTIDVTFTPPATVAGGQAGTLTIMDDAAGSPHTVALGGVGVGPVVVLSATSLNFGSQPVGTTSAAKLVNLSNTGNAPLTIDSLTVTGDFGQANNCPSTLVARSYCTVSVKFTPTAPGARMAAITIVHDAAGSPHTVNLTGTGVSL